MSRWIDQTIVGLDTETTGLNTQEDRIFEIGLVTFRNGELLESWGRLMDPLKPLSKESEEKTGVTNAQVQGQPIFASLVDEISSRLADRILVGYNLLGFDLPLLDAEYRRVGLARPETPVIDVLVLARGLVPTGRHTLTDMARHFGVSLVNAHRATADAEASVRILLAMISSLPAETAELLRLQSQWVGEQRARRAAWRQKDDGRLDQFLTQQRSSSQAMVDEDGRVSLGPGYIYGRETDPLRAFLFAYCVAGSGSDPQNS